MCLVQGDIEFVIRHTNHQLVSHDAAAHTIAIHEGDAAKHPAFRYAWASVERPANSAGKLLVVGHGRSL